MEALELLLYVFVKDIPLLTQIHPMGLAVWPSFSEQDPRSTKQKEAYLIRLHATCTLSVEVPFT